MEKINCMQDLFLAVKNKKSLYTVKNAIFRKPKPAAFAINMCFGVVAKLILENDLYVYEKKENLS